MTQQTLSQAMNYIGGTWHDGTMAAVSTITNPATGGFLAHIKDAGPAEVDAAVASASAAFLAWRRTPPQDRIQYLFRFRELLLKHADDIARTTTQENGKTFAEARANSG